MRFNAFNFAGMKKSTIWVLGIVMGLSFLSLLYLQVSYIEEMVKMRKGQFDESVQRSLVQACRNIELVETKKYLEDDAIATEKAAQLSREQSEEKKGEGSGDVRIVLLIFLKQLFRLVRTFLRLQEPCRK